jgi:hypothetical protein
MFAPPSAKKAFSYFALVVPFLTSPAVPAVAQNCPTCTDSQSASLNPNILEAPSVSLEPRIATQEVWTLRKRVDEVTVFFTVRKGHKYVDDITREEVSVQDDRKPAVRVSSFGRQRDLPLRLGLLVDTSDSVEFRFRFEKEASSRFLQKTVRLNMDRAFVMGFSDEARLAAEYTHMLFFPKRHPSTDRLKP